MSLIKYRAFIKVVDTGSITKTAELMGYSQPGISHMLESLENEFGFPILQRNKQSLTPTENGKKLLGYCYEIIKNENYLHDTVQSINGLLTGTIKIGSLYSMLINIVPQIVKKYSSSFGDVDIHIKETHYEDINDSLRAGSLDIGFTNINLIDDFDFIPLLKDPVILIVPSNHPLAKKKEIFIPMLNDYDFIMPLPGFNDILDEVSKIQKFRPNAKHHVGSDIAVMEMVSNNLGISVLSKQAKELLPDNVVAKDFKEDIHRTMGIAIKSMKHATPAIKEFIDVSIEIIKGGSESIR